MGEGCWNPAPEGRKIGTSPPSDVFDTFPKDNNFYLATIFKVNRHMSCIYQFFSKKSFITDEYHPKIGAFELTFCNLV